MHDMDRLAVFIDYQNAYRGARQAFGVNNAGPGVVGQFDPLKLSELIAARRPSYPGAKLRRLAQAWVYRGMPGSFQSSVGYRAARRQVSRWLSASSGDGLQLKVRTRPLDYRTGRPREKGIDVLLALDLAFGAADDDFDVVVLFSGDSDLLPALERAVSAGVACEAAAWAAGGRQLPKRTTSDGSTAFTGTTTIKSTIPSTTGSGCTPPLRLLQLPPILPAVHHRSSVVHWRGFSCARRAGHQAPSPVGYGPARMLAG